MDTMKNKRLLDINLNVDLVPIAIIGILVFIYMSDRKKKDLKYV
jgi:hypothetical protein